MEKKDLINAVTERLISNKNDTDSVWFTDSDVMISWDSDDQLFCIDGFRANNFVDGYWDYSSSANLKHWIANLKTDELERYLREVA